MEAFSNLLQFPLAAQCAAADQYLQLSSADFAKLPTLGNGVRIRLYCDGEWMMGYALDATNYRVYVQRAQEGSAAALHPSGRAVLHVVSAVGYQQAQSGAIIDQVESNLGDTAGLMGTFWQTHSGLALVIPPGVPLVLHFTSQVFTWQNSAPAGNVATEFRFVNSAGAQVGFGGVKRVLNYFSSVSGGIDGRDVNLRTPLDPLAAADIISVQSWSQQLGAGTKSATITGVFSGIGSPQQFWAEVGI